MIPNCIICGTQKGGTSALRDLLNQHPDVSMYNKEIHYFNWYYDKGWNWYLKHFKDYEAKIVGEKSPTYMCNYVSAYRIHRHIPDAKLIFLLRNPVDRCYSHYWMNVRRGKEKRSFSDAIREPVRKDRYGTCCYLERGLYNRQINLFRDFFDTNQICIIRSENLKNNTEVVLRYVSKFLGIKKHSFDLNKIYTKQGVMPRSKIITSLLQFKIVRCIPVVYDYLALYNNLGVPYPPMNKEDREYLISFYKNHMSLDGWEDLK